ncbi:nuclear transport factor 2 family protein [Massilia sp. TS11]|uniref:nuclear transport factor 2 family protein n=1 Tax=Massilia sp. TS11 TaxID=2908003 RepID=UPI001EDAF1FF|nr:nuclear transport factor 2 family protein [Massilia sp. TS11]MCG2586872.1 nuclear transport factor 2 family protein [Massilia sp. TS11]
MRPALFCLCLLAASASATPEDDAKTVAALDIAYQAAVLRGDADAMAAIVHDRFTLVNGRGTAYDKAALLASTRKGELRFSHQEVVDNSRQVRVLGDTAVVTAKLWLQGSYQNGSAFDRTLWYSDTYVRTPQGWQYFFGQASLALPERGAVTSGPEVEAVRALNEAYLRAWRRHDLDWFRQHLAEQYVCTAPDGSKLDKAAFLAYPDQSAAVKAHQLEDLQITVYGGTTAVVNAVNVVTWQDGRRSASRYTDTYSKEDGKWLAVSAQLTSVPVK